MRCYDQQRCSGSGKQRCKDRVETVVLRMSVEQLETVQRGTGSDLQQSPAAVHREQGVCSCDTQHQVDRQQGNSAARLPPAQLAMLSDEVDELGSEHGTHRGSIADLWSAWLPDCASVELRCVLGDDKETCSAAVSFVGVWYAEFLGYAGLEAEYRPAQHVVSVEYGTECSVGALAEWVSVGCKVLVWRSLDQDADLAD